MKRLYFLAMLCLAGCGKPSVDPAFQPYVDRFEAAATEQGNPVSVSVAIKFDAIDGKTEAGECDYGSLGANTIKISKSDWDGFNDAQRENLVFHELGHCVLHREAHRSDTEYGPVAGGNQDVPCSIMHFGVIDDFAYRQYRDGYLRELFHGGSCAIQ